MWSFQVFYLLNKAVSIVDSFPNEVLETMMTFSIILYQLSKN